MKKKRIIELPDRPLSEDEYEDYSQHAKNSLTWYSENGIYTKNELIEKMLQKGFSSEPVEVETSEGIKDFDIIAEALETLERQHLLKSDEDVASFFMLMFENSEKGPRQLQEKLMTKMVDSSVIQDYVEQYPQEHTSKKAFEYLMKVNKNLEEEKKLEKVRRKMFEKGFDLYYIELLMSKYNDSLEEEENIYYD